MAKVDLASLVADDDDTVEPAGPSTPEPPAVTVTKEAGTERLPEKTPRKRSRATTATTHGGRAAPSTVYTAGTTFRQLRDHVRQRKAKGELVSYGVVTLLAVQQNSDWLKHRWEGGVVRTDTEAADLDDSDSGNLFGITIRQAAPKKVPWQLHGATPQQVKLLDDLVEQWGAPSRSVLVEDALNRYLGQAGRKNPRRKAIGD